MSTVYVVMAGVEAGRGWVEGVYTSVEAAKHAYPDYEWHTGRPDTGEPLAYSTYCHVEPYEVQS